MKNKTIEKHVRISGEIDNHIKNEVIRNKTNYNKELNNLLLRGLSSPELSLSLYNVNTKIDKISNNIYMINMLLKQLYSDMEFSECSDYTKSLSLKEFYKKIKKDKYSD